MKMKSISFLFAVIFLMSVSLIFAEEKFGVTVYPGAKFDSGVTDFLKQISPESAAYRTSASVAKVVEFYKQQPGLKYMGGDKENAMFRKGDIDVTVQSPWMDTKTGKMMNDTLISIVKQKG
ncbi:MAG: hypothetical protein M1508_02315 [Nitrospirae bacterium]|nr:hypothetical protein [Nitrospirota bacterium]